MEGKLVQKSSHLSGSGGEGWSEPPSLLLAAIIRPFLPTPRTCNPTALAGHNNQEIRSRNKNITIAENFFSPNILFGLINQ